MLVRIILALGGAVLLASIFASLQYDGREFSKTMADIKADWWWIVTMVDLYLGFIVAAVFIGFIERSWLTRVLWAAPIFVLGNIWTVVWVLVRLSMIRRRLGG